jgi:dipeptidyl aminopeptidase/acylaminoacyl peptidase
MSAVDRFDQRFVGLLEDLGAATYPDYFDDVLDTAVQRTQRPAWTFPERWLPMGVLAQRPAMIPSVPWRLIAVLAMLLILLAAVAAFIGSRQQVPAPFGPAANGLVVGARDGDIYAYDLGLGTEQLIVGGAESDFAPLISHDGTRIAFLRAQPNEADGETLFTVAPDGSGLRPLLGPDHFEAWAWSPSGDRLAIIKGQPRSLWIVPADGSAPVGPIDPGGVQPSTQVVWRPPDGRDLIINGFDQGQFGIFVVPADGSRAPRRIAAGEVASLGGAYQATPDGALLSFTSVGSEVKGQLVDIESGTPRPFGSRFPDLPNAGAGPTHWGNAIVSPDGKTLVFGRYWDERAGEINHQLWAASSAGDGSDAIPIVPMHRSRSGHDPFWFTFAPDGKSVLVLGNESDDAWLAPVDRFDPQPIDVNIGLLTDPPEWQRKAR